MKKLLSFILTLLLFVSCSESFEPCINFEKSRIEIRSYDEALRIAESAIDALYGHETRSAKGAI